MGRKIGLKQLPCGKLDHYIFSLCINSCIHLMHLFECNVFEVTKYCCRSMAAKRVWAYFNFLNQFSFVDLPGAHI